MKIASTGFNCVRMPYSLDLIFNSNFVVPTVALAANPDLIGKTGLEVFHIMMKALTEANIVIFLNNHNSVAAWCCNVDSEDGIWSNDAYDADKWVESLVYLAEYYAGNPFVIGMDLRNEIHDVKAADRLITWGESKDLDNDWKHATEVASEAIYEKNQDWLIIVSGMCFSFDLRSMVRDHPHIPQENKLVWTTHYYSFSRWWTRAESEFLLKNYEMDWLDVKALCVKGVVGTSLALAITVTALAIRWNYGYMDEWNLIPSSRVVLLASACTVYVIWIAIAMRAMELGKVQRVAM